jgi:AhpD family alkylhydroperoxidase
VSQARPNHSYDDFRKNAAAAYAAMMALGKAIDDGGLEKSLTELVKLRASQINGCAFCLQLHANKAREIGIPPEKIDLVAAWRETTDTFSQPEIAALALTEVLTKLAEGDALDRAYADVARHFDDDQILFLTMTIAMINQWNRIAVGLRFPPPARRRASTAA